MSVEALQNRTRLAPAAFRRVLEWLRREYLVDVISLPDGEFREPSVRLTERGEAVLVSLLERTCELPELR
jgi:hypothetical protein